MCDCVVTELCSRRTSFVVRSGRLVITPNNHDWQVPFSRYWSWEDGNSTVTASVTAASVTARYRYGMVWYITALSQPASQQLQSSSSRMRVIYHNWSATKQRPHPQSVAEISHHSVLSGDRIRQCETSSMWAASVTARYRYGMVWYSRVERPTWHSICRFRDDLPASYWTGTKLVFLTYHVAGTSKTNITTTKWQHKKLNNS